MEAVHPEGLQSVQLLTDIDQQQLVVRPRFYKELGGKLQVTVKDNGKNSSQPNHYGKLLIFCYSTHQENENMESGKPFSVRLGIQSNR